VREHEEARLRRRHGDAEQERIHKRGRGRGENHGGHGFRDGDGGEQRDGLRPAGARNRRNDSGTIEGQEEAPLPCGLRAGGRKNPDGHLFVEDRQRGFLRPQNLRAEGDRTPLPRRAAEVQGVPDRRRTGEGREERNREPFRGSGVLQSPAEILHRQEKAGLGKLQGLRKAD